MRLEEQLIATWSRNLWCETRVLIALSGGADSVALLRAMLRTSAAPNLICAAHYNHGWRGAESDADQAFVTELCKQLDVELHTARADPLPPSSPAESESEESARSARYNYFVSVAYATGARYVATAHTASDRVETLLHNLFRGTGLSGVCRPSLYRSLDQELVLVRPLIGCWRADVEAYLAELGQAFRNDSSNQNLAYRRNWIRQSLLPQIRQTYGQHIDQKLLAFSQIAEEANSLQQQLAENFLASVAELPNKLQEAGRLPRLAQNAFVFPINQHTFQWPVLHQALYQVWLTRNWPLQKMSRTHWEMIRSVWDPSPKPAAADAVAAPVNPISLNLPGGIQLQRHHDYLVLCCTPQPSASE